MVFQLAHACFYCPCRDQAIAPVLGRDKLTCIVVGAVLREKDDQANRKDYEICIEELWLHVAWKSRAREGAKMVQMVQIVVSLDSVVEVSIAGLLKSSRSRIAYWRIADRLHGELANLLGASPYLDLVSGRVRAHVFVELEDACRVIEPAMFPPNEDWCQLCAVSEDAAEFLALSKRLQIERICERVRASLDRYLQAQRRKRDGKVGSREARLTGSSELSWTAIFACKDEWGSGADLKLRHEMESALDAHLQEGGLGSVEGGAIGSGTMEVFFSTGAVDSKQRVERSVRAFLRKRGFPVPLGLLYEEETRSPGG